MDRLDPFYYQNLKRFHDVTHAQAEKGYKKYKKSLDPFGEENHDWVEMAEQEIVDAWRYIQCIRETRPVVTSVANGIPTEIVYAGRRYTLAFGMGEQ